LLIRSKRQAVSEFANFTALPPEKAANLADLALGTAGAEFYNQGWAAAMARGLPPPPLPLPETFGAPSETAMRISVKLMAGVLVLAALVAGVGFLTNLTDQAIETQVNYLSRSSLPEVVDAAEMAIAIQTSHDALHDLIYLKRSHAGNADAAMRPAANEVARLQRTIQSSLATFQRSYERSRQANEELLESVQRAGNAELAATAANNFSKRLKQMGEAFTAHRALVKDCLRLIDSDLHAAEDLLEGKLDDHFNDVLFPLIQNQKAQAEQEFTHEIHGVGRAVAAAKVRNTVATLFALLAALTMGLLLARWIGKPLAELKTAAVQIGRGQLETRVKFHSRDEVGVLANTFNEMAVALQATTVSKAYVDNILESMNELLIVADAQGKVRMANRAAQRELGFAPAELVGRPVTSLLADATPGANGSPAFRSLIGDGEHLLLAKSGACVPVHWAASELHGAGGEFQGIVCAALNIAERKEAEQQLRDSLEEKEVLLKEVHHRVKNNLQIISSLLALQARETTDPANRRMFEESQGRIRSMALIHEQLYQSGELARINFAEYARRLCEHLVDSTAEVQQRVRLNLAVEPIPLPLNCAIPCGMILNELISNALKHAFPGDRGGEIQVQFTFNDGRNCLTVRDNGVGLDPAAAKAKSGSLGLKVVDALVKQLGGRLTIENHAGAAFTIEFATEAPTNGKLVQDKLSVES
jgi:PAS domain S-box-containing protein